MLAIFNEYIFTHRIKYMNNVASWCEKCLSLKSFYESPFLFLKRNPELIQADRYGIYKAQGICCNYNYIYFSQGYLCIVFYKGYNLVHSRSWSDGPNQKFLYEISAFSNSATESQNKIYFLRKYQFVRYINCSFCHYEDVRQSLLQGFGVLGVTRVCTFL